MNGKAYGATSDAYRSGYEDGYRVALQAARVEWCAALRRAASDVRASEQAARDMHAAGYGDITYDVRDIVNARTDLLRVLIDSPKSEARQNS